MELKSRSFSTTGELTAYVNINKIAKEQIQSIQYLSDGKGLGGLIKWVLFWWE